MTRRERFVMMPEQLPQSWLRLTHAARGMAYDWWRTFGPEVVSLKPMEVCTAVGTPPRSRKKAPAWLDEMVEHGALQRCEGGLRMGDLIPKRRPRSGPEADPKLPHNDPTADPPRPRSGPEATPQRPHEEAQRPGIAGTVHRYIQTEREKDASDAPALAHLRELIASSVHAAGQPTPKLGAKVLGDVLPRVREVAQLHECGFDVAADRLTSAALEHSRAKGKDLVWALQDCDVPAPAPAYVDAGW